MNHINPKILDGVKIDALVRCDSLFEPCPRCVHGAIEPGTDSGNLGGQWTAPVLKYFCMDCGEAFCESCPIKVTIMFLPAVQTSPSLYQNHQSHFMANPIHRYFIEHALFIIQNPPYCPRSIVTIIRSKCGGAPTRASSSRASLVL